jgi:uncharacterized protein (DUF1015 family)
MADIVPFKGIVYNSAIIPDMAAVVTPPYDVISPSEQQDAYACHPQNVIRLILPRKHADDNESVNWCTRAAESHQRWLEQDILTQDDNLAIYPLRTGFNIGGQIQERMGFIALVRLMPFDKGIILPHEKTFSRVKSDRLKLMKATHANFCPIFSLFRDPDLKVNQTLNRTIEDQAPMMDFTDRQGFHHTLWRLEDPAIHQQIGNRLSARRIFIADGHHRYETALNYQAWLKARGAGIDKNHPANFVMMYFCAMEDPGLVILPAHRLLKEIDARTRSGFVAKASRYFEIETYPFTASTLTECRQRFVREIGAQPDRPTFGVVIKEQNAFLKLSLKPEIRPQDFDRPLPNIFYKLDVCILTQLLFRQCLGFDRERLDNDRLIGYAHLAYKAIEGVLDDTYDMAFLHNPTRIEQLCAVAEQGLIMPRKSTYFYPKILSGLVLASLKPN